MATITGTSGVDTLNGTVNTDFIYGLAGNDTLNGNGSGDELYGGDGNDILNGNDGDDYLEGGIGTNTMSGGNGADYLLDFGGSSHLYGNANDDLLQASDGNDTLDGGSGNDELDAGYGVNVDLLSGGGSDIVFVYADLFGTQDTTAFNFTKGATCVGGDKIRFYSGDDKGSAEVFDDLDSDNNNVLNASDANVDVLNGHLTMSVDFTNLTIRDVTSLTFSDFVL